MKKLINYYVVDSLTESVIGSFKAVNNEMAIRILDESFKKNDKLQAISDSLMLYYDANTFDISFETYDEVMENCFDIKWKVVSVPKKISDSGDIDGKK